jgi:UDP-glucuronate 4-epimerase
MDIKSINRKKNVLVTGGAGFIGSALAKRLHDEGNTVVVLDNFNDYYDPSLKRARQDALLQGIEAIEGDITNTDLIEKVFAEHQFDVVCHFAAQAGVRYSVENPSAYVLTNVLGTQILLEAMQKYCVKQMVYASTSSAYGIDAQSPFQEIEKADKPVSVYATTKRSGELLAHSYHAQYCMDVTCLRFFTVYGPWSRPDMAMLKFAQQMTAREAIDIYNEGDLQRDFTYIDDIVEGFVLSVHTPLGYEVLNIGNGKPVELMDFLSLLEKELGIEAKKNMLPMQQGDVFQTYADTTKVKELLGFEAKTNFEEGVKKFVGWYKEYYNA